MAELKCENCGFENDENAKVCKGCNKELIVENVEEKVEENAEITNAENVEDVQPVEAEQAKAAEDAVQDNVEQPAVEEIEPKPQEVVKNEISIEIADDTKKPEKSGGVNSLLAHTHNISKIFNIILGIAMLAIAAVCVVLAVKYTGSVAGTFSYIMVVFAFSVVAFLAFAFGLYLIIKSFLKTKQKNDEN